MADKKAELEKDRKPNPGTIQELANQIADIKKEVGKLKDILNVQENWGSEIKKLLGEKISVCVVDGKCLHGHLLWTDRYNICISVEYQLNEGKYAKRVIIPKGSIVCLEPTGVT